MGSSPAVARRFTSRARTLCPDCGSEPAEPLGQFVYYATDMKLLPCPACGLWWVSALLDRPILEAHFETAYKEEGGYYTRRRRAIFHDMVGQISRVTPLRGRVLDVGGAMGHLLASLSRRRSDLRTLLTDCSRVAVEAAQRRGFRAVQLAGDELGRLEERFDTIVLSDVLYYVAHLDRFWEALPRLLLPGGALVIRYPNKQGLIRLVGRWGKQQIPFFNPEHLFVLTPRYLERRLNGLGFLVEHRSSPLLRGEANPRMLVLVDAVLAAMAWLTRGRVVLSPSRVLVARRKIRDSSLRSE